MSIEHAKAIAETFAIIAAGGFFLYKFFTGYLVTNLSVSLSCIRYSHSKNTAAENECLIVIATLTKGERGSLRLHDTGVKVRYEKDGKPEEQEGSLLGVERLSFKTERLHRVEQKSSLNGSRSKAIPDSVARRVQSILPSLRCPKGADRRGRACGAWAKILKRECLTCQTEICTMEVIFT